VIRQLALLIVLPVLLVPTAYGADKSRDDGYYEVVVADPYIEMHTGAGRGYPVFYVVERGRHVKVLKRRTDWFLVRTERGMEGWVTREQLLATLDLEGKALDLHEPSRTDYTTRRWEGGVFLGDFGGADEISTYAGYALSNNLSVEVTASHAIGNFSNSLIGEIGLAHVFAPEWRVSPLFTIGTGFINTKPKTTLVQAQDRSDQLAYAGVGVRGYLTRRFSARLEYRNNVVFTSRNHNEVIDEWKLGFTFFF
jgi:uncharacterized protein YgiM (DUF1202 family)